MKILVDDNAGFCWGVVQTIDKVEQILSEKSVQNCCVLGEIIHNPHEIKRLEKKKLVTIEHEDLAKVDPNTTTVIIRAHGEPPETYNILKKLNIPFVDATCPLVKKLQELVESYYKDGWQIVIYGKYEHAEVIGLRGVCRNECCVGKTLEELKSKIDFSKKTMLCSQTTMDTAGLLNIKKYIEEYLEIDIASNFIFKNTICKFVTSREKKLREFAKNNEMIIFVAGRNSSNGKVLFRICKEANKNTIFIEDSTDIDLEEIKNFNNIGITGATSTPKWFLEKIKKELEMRLLEPKE